MGVGLPAPESHPYQVQDVSQTAGGKKFIDTMALVCDHHFVFTTPGNGGGPGFTAFEKVVDIRAQMCIRDRDHFVCCNISAQKAVDVVRLQLEDPGLGYVVENIDDLSLIHI